MPHSSQVIHSCCQGLSMSPWDFGVSRLRSLELSDQGGKPAAVSQRLVDADIVSPAGSGGDFVQQRVVALRLSFSRSRPLTMICRESGSSTDRDRQFDSIAARQGCCRELPVIGSRVGSGKSLTFAAGRLRRHLGLDLRQLEGLVLKSVGEPGVDIDGAPQQVRIPIDRERAARANRRSKRPWEMCRRSFVGSIRSIEPLGLRSKSWSTASRRCREEIARPTPIKLPGCTGDQRVFARGAAESGSE